MPILQINEKSDIKVSSSNLSQFLEYSTNSNGLGAVQSFVRNCLQDFYILVADCIEMSPQEYDSTLYPLKRPLSILNFICIEIVEQDKHYKESKHNEILSDAFIKDSQKSLLIKKLKQTSLLLPNDLLLQIVTSKADPSDKLLVQHLVSQISKPMLAELVGYIKFGCSDLPSFSLDWIHHKLQFICNNSKYTNLEDYWHDFIDVSFTITPQLYSMYICGDKQSKFTIDSCIQTIYLKANKILLDLVFKNNFIDWLVARKTYFLLLPSDQTEYFIHSAYDELSLEETQVSTSRLQLLYESCHKLLFMYPKIKKRSRARGYMIEQTNNTPNKSLTQSITMKNRLISHSLLDLLRLEYPSNNLINLAMDESIEQCYRNLFELQWLLRVSHYELRKCYSNDKSVVVNLMYIKHVISTIIGYTGSILSTEWDLLYTDIQSCVELSQLKQLHQTSLYKMCDACFLPVDDVVIVLDLMRSTREFALLLQKNQSVVAALSKWRTTLNEFTDWVKLAGHSKDSETITRTNGLLIRLNFNSFKNK